MGRLFWKFFLSILLAQVAATIGIGGTFWLREQSLIRNGTPAIDASPPAELLMNAAGVAYRHGGVTGLRDMIGVMRLHTVIVLDDQGRDVLGRPVPPELRAQARRAFSGKEGQRTVRALLTPEGKRLLVFVPRDYRVAATPATGAAPGIVPAGPQPLFARHIGRRAPLLAAIGASLMVAALLAWYFSNRIRALRSAFQAAAGGDLSPRFAALPRHGDELSQLGQDFDRMSARLRAVLDGQRRLLHDVSHELRSPLARLQAAIGLAHQQPDKAAVSLERIERESVRMDKLVGELLTLARLDGQPSLPASEAVDLGELVEQVAEDARFEAGEAGPRITVSGTLQGTVNGAPDLLWRAVENVVRNAVRHGGAGGIVQIVLSHDGGICHLNVLDRGPGVDPGHLASVFDPFFRAEPDAGRVGGHGLGLAIAQRVIEAHGGTIAADNRRGGGLAVAITLPRIACTKGAAR